LWSQPAAPQVRHYPHTRFSQRPPHLSKCTNSEFFTESSCFAVPGGACGVCSPFPPSARERQTVACNLAAPRTCAVHSCSVVVEFVMHGLGTRRDQIQGLCCRLCAGVPCLTISSETICRETVVTAAAVRVSSKANTGARREACATASSHTHSSIRAAELCMWSAPSPYVRIVHSSYAYCTFCLCVVV
jgi:hypothetical protein